MHCFCQKPLNPNLLSVACDKCNKWFHSDCVKENEEIKEKNFYCSDCVKINNFV